MQNRNKTFTLIETLAFLFVFSIVAVTFYTVFGVGMRHIAESKNRLGAIAVANEKMEIIRNLSYDDVGVVGGIPNGSILSDEDVVENTRSYHVTTFAQYIDDAFDGTLAAASDTIPNDYKRVKVTVSWGTGSGQEISMVSSFVPPGLEVSAGDGILAINVLNRMGEGVPQSSVNIVNNAVNPAVNIATQTDDTGNLMFPGAEESAEYSIVVAKNGYETVATVDPASVPYVPSDPHASVLSGSVTMKSIIQDILSNLTINSVDHLGVSMPNVNFHLKGGRVLGALDLDNVYQTDSDTSTNGSGELNLNLTSPGEYFFDDIATPADYTLIGVDSLSSYDSEENIYGISLPPDTSKSVNIKFASNIVDSLLVRAVNDADSLPVSSAQIKVTNGAGYDVTQSTLGDGVAFFTDDENPLAAGTYTVEVQASGFQTETSSVDVSQLTTKEIRLTVL